MNSKYKIVMSDRVFSDTTMENLEIFNNKISELLQDGWELYGTPFEYMGMKVAQALVMKQGSYGDLETM